MIGDAISWIGEVTIKKRCPSAETTKLLPHVVINGAGDANRARGAPASRLAPCNATGTAMTCPSGAPKKSSLPSCLHIGDIPPSLESCHFAPVAGNVWTYTSARPDSSDP